MSAISCISFIGIGVVLWVEASVYFILVPCILNFRADFGGYVIK